MQIIIVFFFSKNWCFGTDKIFHTYFLLRGLKSNKLLKKSYPFPKTICLKSYVYPEIYRGYSNVLLNMAFISPSEVENINIS